MDNSVSALSSCSAVKIGETISEETLNVAVLSPVTMIRMQVSGSREVIQHYISSASFPLATPGQFSVKDDIKCHWITPKEWVFESSKTEPNQLIKMLDNDSSSINQMLTNISDSRIVFKISGESVEDYLSIGCALDFTLSGFEVGKSTISRLFSMPALLSRTKEDEFDLIVDRSFASYVEDRLIDSATEFSALAERFLS